jgi:hypothetical protein
MTSYKVTMTPASADWQPGDLRWACGYHLGLWQSFTDPAKAYDCMEDATALGFAVALEHVEEPK